MYVLTVFPFGDIDDAPDDYEVEDWAVGLLMVLCKQSGQAQAHD